VDVLARYDEWLDLVRELLAEPGGSFPRGPVARHLAESFDIAEIMWSWADRGGGAGLEHPSVGQAGCGDARWPMDLLAIHPLRAWYLQTADPRPTTLGRVPRTIAPGRAFEAVREEMAPSGLEHQLAIPYRMDRDHCRAFVLARTREDFTEDDLDLAHRIQPLLALLERHAAVPVRGPCFPTADVGLTLRERTVLQLLADGSTARAIGRRLAISPRTVHHHLCSLYRKLGVNDRLQAVLVAQELGLLATLSADEVGPPSDSGSACGAGVPVPRLTSRRAPP
jgi:DNA-binding CsgD family transcriptional regulator